MNSFRKKWVLVSTCFGIIYLVFFPRVALAQDSPIESLKSQLKEMQQQMQKMAERLEQLEKEKAADTAKLGQVEQSVRAVQSVPSVLNPAIGLVIDATAERRARVGSNFNFRAAELGLAASVDPFARAFGFINANREGVELEEATIVTTSLPWNLTARGGRLFADFGRLPKLHEHELPFVNFPLSVQRMEGGESKADGVEFNYLFPTPFFLRATVGGYNKIGDKNDRVDNKKPRALTRFTYLGRLNTYFDLTDDHSVELGSSLAYTPSSRFAGQGRSGSDRTLTGIDLTYRYQPLARALYQGITLGGEFLSNSESVQRSEGIHDRRQAFGGYSYAELKLNRNWSTGFLFDHSPSISSPGKKTLSYSPYLTWNISEFNRLRFQYSFLNDDVRTDKLNRTGSQLFLQWTTVIGSHTHGFRTR
jgi:hypothetical protein